MSTSFTTINKCLFTVAMLVALMPLSLRAETEPRPTPDPAVVQEQPVKQKQLLADKRAVDNLVRPATSNVDLVQIVTALAGVIALIVVASWLMRRMGNVTGQRNEQMRVVAALSMGARERVVLMQVGEQQILLGVAPGRIQTLHVLDKPLDMTSSSHPVTAFQDRLKKIMSRETES